jgi:5'-nucleotidase
MNILVTNDDGVAAPGLLALAQAMRPLGEVTILAPDRNWSASGHVKTMNRPLRVQPAHLLDGTPALASDGAPSDCVALALLGVVQEKIDLVVSGINPNANIGYDVTYSGTVTAAMEAVIAGVPGIAVSLDSPEGFSGALDFSTAAQAGQIVAKKVLENGLPPGVLLNVNVPYLPFAQVSGFTVTRHGLRIYRDRLDARTDPRGRPYYWIGGDSPTGLAEDGTDFGALKAGWISVTPLHLDLTAHQALPAIMEWQWETPKPS